MTYFLYQELICRIFHEVMIQPTKAILIIALTNKGKILSHKYKVVNLNSKVCFFILRIK